MEGFGTKAGEKKALLKRNENNRWHGRNCRLSG
jgi:hypothetical protein